MAGGQIHEQLQTLDGLCNNEEKATQMAITMANIHFDFPNVTGSQQRQNRQLNFNGVGRTIQRAAVMLQGFEVHFSNGDHHVLQERVQLDILSTSGGVVDVAATFLLRDGSGNIDDPYSGTIDAVVIADVV